MPKEVLDEREFELINIIGANLGSNQRDLSCQMDRSLGLTNMLIRRLVTKGYIRISQLNKRKVQYVLTPKGFAEKMRKSIKYTVKTICSIGLIKDRIKEIVQKLYFEEKEKNFIILGKSDLALLIEIVFRELNLSDIEFTFTDEFPEDDVKGVLMICKEDVDVDQGGTRKTVDLIHELAKDSFFINQIGSLI